MTEGTIEVAPLAYMRGRTLNDAFVILDEAQNTSPEQMKMFLTRLGFGSKMVVTGDVTQIDLPTGTHSGLKIVEGILDGLDDVHFSRLSSHDVVRHRLVSEIVDAYSRFDAEQSAGGPPSRGGGREPGRGQRREDVGGAPGDDRDHRGQQRDRDRPRRERSLRPVPIRSRPDAHSSAGRAGGAARRSRDHGAAARAVDG